MTYKLNEVVNLFHLIVKKKKVAFALNMMALFFVASVLSIDAGYIAVSGINRTYPITSVQTDSKKIILTVDINEEVDIDSLLMNLKNNDIKACFFADCDYAISEPENLKKVALYGHEIGLLIKDGRGKTRREINDMLAQGIEYISNTVGFNIDFVRFYANRYDNNAVKAVYAVDLVPLQWAADGTAQKYGCGDIILANDVESINFLVIRLKKDGLQAVLPDEIIQTENYEVDFAGKQSKRYMTT